MPGLESAKKQARQALIGAMRACVANDRIPLLAKVAFVTPSGGLLKALGVDNDERPVESEYGTRFVAGRNGSIITSWLRFRGAFEPVLSEFILRHVQEGDYCLDVGANIGYFSLLFAKRVAPSGKVIAIEAAPDTARRLRANLELNKAAGIVDVVEAACAPQKGEVTFYLHPHFDGMSRLTPPPQGKRTRGILGTWTPVTVTADTLTSIVGVDAPRISFIKVDIEGAEAAIAPQLANDFTHPGLVVALEVRAPIDATLAPFQEQGFYVYDLHNDYHWIFERKVPAITEVTYDELYRRRVADVLLSRKELRLA